MVEADGVDEGDKAGLSRSSMQVLRSWMSADDPEVAKADARPEGGA